MFPQARSIGSAEPALPVIVGQHQRRFGTGLSIRFGEAASVNGMRAEHRKHLGRDVGARHGLRLTIDDDRDRRVVPIPEPDGIEGSRISPCRRLGRPIA